MQATQLKFALTIAGLIIWAVGLRLDNAAIRWVGIAAIALAFLVRFHKPRSGEPMNGAPD